MFELYLNNKVMLFEFLEAAIAVAKESVIWYYITNGKELIWTQDDEIMELLNE